MKSYVAAAAAAAAADADHVSSYLRCPTAGSSYPAGDHHHQHYRHGHYLYQCQYQQHSDYVRDSLPDDHDLDDDGYDDSYDDDDDQHDAWWEGEQKRGKERGAVEE